MYRIMAATTAGPDRTPTVRAIRVGTRNLHRMPVIAKLDKYEMTTKKSRTTPTMMMRIPFKPSVDFAVAWRYHATRLNRAT
jgi:hypothetical protein